MLYLVLYLVSSYCFKKYPLLNTKYRGIYENKESIRTFSFNSHLLQSNLTRHAWKKKFTGSISYSSGSADSLWRCEINQLRPNKQDRRCLLNNVSNGRKAPASGKVTSRSLKSSWKLQGISRSACYGDRFKGPLKTYPKPWRRLKRSLWR